MTEAQATDVARGNLALAREMYDRVLLTFDTQQIDRFFAPDYIQHGSLAEDGREGLRGFLTKARAEYPDARSRIVRVFADGDFVIFHVHVILTPGSDGLAVVDIFRIAGGLIREHWEVIQPVPATLPHGNGTF